MIGATWTVSGSGKDWNVDGGALQIAAGGVLSSATVSSGGTLVVLSGGFAGPTAIHSGGTLIIDGGTADVRSGATVSAPITFVSTGGTLERRSCRPSCRAWSSAGFPAATPST